MMRDRILVSTNNAAQPKGPYSQAIVSGDLLFVSGQGPVDTVSQDFIRGSAEEQIRLTLQNLNSVVEAAGFRLARALKINVYLADMGDFGILNTVYPEFFDQPYPARTTCQSNLPGFAVEIDAIVVRG